jgi:K+-transporting ATPase ATPase C chain
MKAAPVPAPKRETTLTHLLTSVIYTVVSVIGFGFIFPLVIWGLSTVLFHYQAGGSLITQNGKLIGSELVGQNFAKPQYFHPRPSAAGAKGYDPTSTGGTNFGPTSKKLLDATKATVAQVRKENPTESGPVPADLVSSSASGIDPDISPEAAAYQVARVAKARGMTVDSVDALVARATRGRTLGIFGEPRVNVLDLNRMLDAAKS